MSNKNVEFVATAKAFFRGGRIRPGDKFKAPEDFEASWAKPASEHDPEEEAPDLLSFNAREVISEVNDLDDLQALHRLRDAETSGARRKTVLGAINDRIANVPQEKADAAADTAKADGDDLIG